VDEQSSVVMNIASKTPGSFFCPLRGPMLESLKSFDESRATLEFLTLEARKARVAVLPERAIAEWRCVMGKCKGERTGFECTK
jgi:hypothetical protein